MQLRSTSVGKWNRILLSDARFGDTSDRSTSRLRDDFYASPNLNQLGSDKKMASPDSRSTRVFEALREAFTMFDTQDDYRFEVRQDASIYVRKGQLRSGQDVARINGVSIRNFPNLNELRSYIEDNGVQMDHTGRDYLIGAEHIDRVIQILQR